MDDPVHIVMWLVSCFLALNSAERLVFDVSGESEVLIHGGENNRTAKGWNFDLLSQSVLVRHPFLDPFVIIAIDSGPHGHVFPGSGSGILFDRVNCFSRRLPFANF